MKIPYVVCHMMASLDGRIDCAMTEHLGSVGYYEALTALKADATVEGKTTVAMHYAAPGVFEEAQPEPVGEDGFWKSGNTGPWTVVADTRGTLLWPEDVDPHRVCLVSQKATKGYLAYLRERGLSYIVAGRDEIDLRKALEVLAREFDVERVVVTGGGTLNGSFLREGLLDEVSMVYGPGIDGRAGFVTAFEGIARSHEVPYLLKLLAVRPMAEDAVWLRYQVK